MKIIWNFRNQWKLYSEIWTEMLSPAKISPKLWNWPAIIKNNRRRRDPGRFLVVCELFQAVELTFEGFVTILSFLNLVSWKLILYLYWSKFGDRFPLFCWRTEDQIIFIALTNNDKYDLLHYMPMSSDATWSCQFWLITCQGSILTWKIRPNFRLHLSNYDFCANFGYGLIFKFILAKTKRLVTWFIQRHFQRLFKQLNRCINHNFIK